MTIVTYIQLEKIRLCCRLPGDEAPHEVVRQHGQAQIRAGLERATYQVGHSHVQQGRRVRGPRKAV